jgi:Rv0078B-related antitoxin
MVRMFGILHGAGKMNPDRALDDQIERYRRMTGEERLALALELHELSCNVAREGIRQQNPDANEAEVERLLRQRLELARQ